MSIASQHSNEYIPATETSRRAVEGTDAMTRPTGRSTKDVQTAR